MILVSGLAFLVKSSTVEKDSWVFAKNFGKLKKIEAVCLNVFSNEQIISMD